MNNRIRIAFLLLVVAQALHSVEEYAGKLWDVYAPARFICGLVSANHKTGFIIIDTALILFGLWCWLFPLRKNYSYAKALLWWWIVMETINGIGHIVWALSEKTYTPGVASAPVILILVIYLAKQLLHSDSGLPGKK